MISYEVTSVVDESLAEEFEQYMRGEHIPDLLATGCFRSASFASSDEPGRFRSTYLAPDRSSMERYLAEHATRLRDHVHQRFPQGVRSTRETWEVRESW